MNTYKDRPVVVRDLFDDGNLYYWDEDSLTWVVLTPPAE